MSNIYISSFHKDNISPYLLFYQRQVFRMLNIELHQICDNNISHGDFLTKTLRKVNAEYFVFFDVDCIPLTKQAIEMVIKEVTDKTTIAGSAQTANQYQDGRNLYVGPFFFAISKNVYDKLGQPDLNGNKDEQVDVGGILTKLAPKYGINLNYWYPTSVEEKRWDMYPDKEFGIGTTYENMVYHLFESRYSKNIVKFVRKSKQTINRHANRNILTYLIILIDIQLFKIKMNSK